MNQQQKEKQNKILRASALRCLISVSSLLSMQLAIADEQDPLNFIVGVSRAHDNNLFRSPTRGQSDNITSAYAGIRLDKQYAQQRFKFDFTLTAHRYQNYGILDFNAKDYKAAWLWTLTPYLTGTVSLDRKQTLNSFQDFRNNTNNGRSVRNIFVRETQHFEADFSPHNVWHFLGGYTRSTQKNSADDAAFIGQNSFASDSADAGVRYQFSSGSSITAMGHLRQGDYKDRQISSSSIFDNAYDEQEVETRLDWIVTGKSRIYARAAYLTRDHDHFSVWDYSGLVGNIDFSWSPTAKIKLIASAASHLDTFQTLDSSYARTTTFSIRPVYALSSKITMNAHADISRRSFHGNVDYVTGFNNFPTKGRVDWTKSAGIGVDWMPVRNFSVGGNLERSSRSSNIEVSNVDIYDYDDTTLGVNANLLF